VPRLTREGLVEWGEALGRTLRAPRVLTLAGEVGAGKTTLAQAICRGLGVEEPVTSPTYALVHEYDGVRSTVYHLDLYRLRDPRDLLQLGWDEIVSSPAIVLVEWPERAEGFVPDDALRLQLAHVSGEPEYRDVEIDA